MIYSAILVACMVSTPSDCKTHEILLVSTMPVPLALEAQSRAAEWLALHPDLSQRSLTIRPGRSA